MVKLILGEREIGHANFSTDELLNALHEPEDKVSSGSWD
jgi:hypothetical protein